MDGRSFHVWEVGAAFATLGAHRLAVCACEQPHGTFMEGLMSKRGCGGYWLIDVRATYVLRVVVHSVMWMSV